MSAAKHWDNPLKELWDKKLKTLLYLHATIILMISVAFFQNGGSSRQSPCQTAFCRFDFDLKHYYKISVN